MTSWLVVSTHLKNISQNGSFPQVGVEIKNITQPLFEAMKVETGQVGRTPPVPLPPITKVRKIMKLVRIGLMEQNPAPRW